MAQLTAWDTPQDAREFFDAYAKRTLKRYPEAKENKLNSDRIRWESETGGVAMELRGSRVVIFEGIPAKTNTNRLLRLVWQNAL